jgi:hypothetical protein
LYSAENLEIAFKVHANAVITCQNYFYPGRPNVRFYFGDNYLIPYENDAPKSQKQEKKNICDGVC